MTAIRGFADTGRRPGEFGVHSLDHFGLAVPDVAAAHSFYSSFGLEVRADHAELGLYAAGSPHRWGVIAEGPSKRLQYRSFAAYEEDFAVIRGRLEKLGIKRLDAPEGIESAGLWFRDHDGELVEVRVAERTSPGEKSPFGCPSAPAGIRGAHGRSTAVKVQPRRLAHLLVFTRDVNRAIEFYCGVLGLRLSDRSGDAIAFLHGIHGSDHHQIAFAKSTARDCIIAVGTSARFRKLDWAPCKWQTKDSAKGGDSAATCSDRIISITSGIRGAVTRSTPQISTTFPATATGPAATILRRILFICGVLKFPGILS